MVIKKLIDQNRLKKFKQVEVDMKCMQANFGGHGHSGFGDFAYFCLPSKRPKFPLVHGHQKIELPQKVMHVEVDMKCMQTNFGWCGFSGFEDIATFKNGQISILDHYCPWSSKNLIVRNRLNKFKQIEVDM